MKKIRFLLLTSIIFISGCIQAAGQAGNPPAPGDWKYSGNLSGLVCSALNNKNLNCVFQDDASLIKSSGSSMDPFLTKDSFVIYRWLRGHDFDFEMGGVYVYEPKSNVFFIHRCIQTNGTHCVMKGDANAEPDNLIYGAASKSQIVGKLLWEVRRIG